MLSTALASMAIAPVPPLQRGRDERARQRRQRVGVDLARLDRGLQQLPPEGLGPGAEEDARDGAVARDHRRGVLEVARKVVVERHRDRHALARPAGAGGVR